MVAERSSGERRNEPKVTLSEQEAALAPDALMLRFSKLETMYADLAGVNELLAKYSQMLDDWR